LSGPAQRTSRALQFVPGHVHGRVASAQPVVRRGGSLGRVSAPVADPSDPCRVDVFGAFAGTLTGGYDNSGVWVPQTITFPGLVPPWEAYLCTTQYVTGTLELVLSSSWLPSDPYLMLLDPDNGIGPSPSPWNLTPGLSLDAGMPGTGFPWPDASDLIFGDTDYGGAGRPGITNPQTITSTGWGFVLGDGGALSVGWRLADVTLHIEHI
jgi:hypothetical protein